MTKTELATALAARIDSDKKRAGEAIDALSEIILHEVSTGGAVTLPDIAKISLRDRPARTVRNPATGESMQKEADRAVMVTIAKKLKDSVNA